MRYSVDKIKYSYLMPKPRRRSEKARMVDLFQSLANTEKWLVIRVYYAQSKNEKLYGTLSRNWKEASQATIVVSG